MNRDEFKRIEEYRDELLYFYNNEPGLSNDNKEELLMEIANVNEFVWDTYLKEISGIPYGIEVIELERVGGGYPKEIKRVFKSMIKVMDYYKIESDYGDFYYKVRKTNSKNLPYTHKTGLLTTIRIKIREE
jgi:hypothetical protein